ncbi:MAG: enoyl-CoA hydratase/isomerase family protein [Spirochaetales bacterium]|jgi:enoyl-CoA hydratase/carnithine racemase|nr:enoyl-CoA hydratase/isomerase family protein [Spirochaetales bacterium]
MIKSMRQSTIQTLGLGSVLEIFSNGKLPVNTSQLVDEVFGPPGDRGALVISGANGIVGAGKLMQLGVRLEPYNIPLVGLDMAGAPDGIAMQYQGLAASFGKKRADKIMSNMVFLNYDGVNIPDNLKRFNPKVLIEAIPEVLEIKKSHYKMLRDEFPELEIRSVTSGFPSSELDVGITHPAFPHQINKVWEIVENKPSKVTQLLWSLGLLPLPVSDHWAFVLDVLFCGLTLAGLRYQEATNMPFWKIDKYVRKLAGPNPFRAHDVIGAKGANFLTWSCLHHLDKHYGSLFNPTDSLVEHKDSGQNWYPLNHLRPMVNWSLDEEGQEEFETWILGPIFQMTSIMLHENRSHLSIMNSIGELCAQFRQGVLAIARNYGYEKVLKITEKYHALDPESGKTEWFPAEFANMDSRDWQQLYVNAEHAGTVGVITISRESYNQDVNDELNRAIDWLKTEKIDRVILTGDFHMATQLVGADTAEFYPALGDEKKGYDISFNWSKTARRLNDEFKTSVGYIQGKRCLGGMLELFVHCHYLVSDEAAKLGAPEVTLPVVPGMEMCHWPFRKTGSGNYEKLLRLLLEGNPVKAKDSVGWLVDFAGKEEDAIAMTWNLAVNAETAMPQRQLISAGIVDIPEVGDLSVITDSGMKEARKAIYNNVIASCEADIAEAIAVQARNSAVFMTSKACMYGFVGSDYKKTMLV